MYYYYRKWPKIGKFLCSKNKWPSQAQAEKKFPTHPTNTHTLEARKFSVSSKLGTKKGPCKECLKRPIQYHTPKRSFHSFFFFLSAISVYIVSQDLQKLLSFLPSSSSSSSSSSLLLISLSPLKEKRSLVKDQITTSITFFLVLHFNPDMKLFLCPFLIGSSSV